MNPQTQKFNHKTIGIFLSIATVILVGLVTFVSEYSDGDTDQTATSSTTSTQNTSSAQNVSSASSVPNKSPTPVTSTLPPATIPKNSASAYRDGTYSANGTYMSPGGPDEIAVTLTLVNGIVTDANVTSVTADRKSAQYQNRFILGYKQYVVGKSISSINLTNVSGSSLTPIGFNNALSQIKSQAKA